MDTTSLSVIVPAFNEEGNINDAIESVLFAVDGLVDDFEIIVVNDGSSDRTAELAAHKSRLNRRIRTIPDFER